MEQRVPVTARALVQRINRQLKKNGVVLRRARGEKAVSEKGEYYISDERSDLLFGMEINIEEYGRELGVLKDSEYLAE
jgi:predicted transcriptional regulator